MNSIASAILLSALLFVSPLAALASEDAVSFGRFGKIALYRTSSQPSHVVLFVSGDGGWNKGVVDMARTLAFLDSVVAGVDITHYLRTVEASRENCAYVAADFEELSKFVQKRISLPRYVTPVLVGYSSGATLVYAALVQAPPTTFRGAISLGFCPDLEVSKPLCRGNDLASTKRTHGKGYDLQPSSKLESPWIAFQGNIDEVCSPSRTEAFVKQVPAGQIVLLPKVGHGFSVERNWLPQFRDAFARLVREDSAPVARTSLADLPLVEMESANTGERTLAVIVSGDGGWAGIDRDVGTQLAKNGVSAVGLNSLQYFWTAKTPEGSGADLERILRYYLDAWHKERVVLVGYSLGADVLPFMTERLPPDLRRKVSLMALLGPGESAEFEFHIGDWIRRTPSPSAARPLLPVVQRLRDVKIVCFYGSDEKESLCRKTDPRFVTSVELKGGHHFGGDYTAIVSEILRSSKTTGRNADSSR